MPNQAERRASVGWSILSDRDLIDWWENFKPHYEGMSLDLMDAPVGFLDALKDRGLVIAECTECGDENTVRKAHDYVCLACRRKLNA